MSLRAILWALEEAPVDDPQTLLVLIALADRAGSDGTAAWPTRAWIAQRARCSVETVKRRLRTLRDTGLIREGDQGHVAHLPANRRPTVYDLNLSRVRETPQESLGGQAGGSGGSDEASWGVTVDPQTVLIEPREEPSVDRTPARTTEPDGFDEFWKAYPHRPSDPKGRARINYAKALKGIGTPPVKATPEELLAGAQGYAKSRQGEDRKFNKGAANWLTEQGWLDYMPEAAGDVIAECLAEGAMERLEELTGLVFEANYLALQDLRGEGRKAALLSQWRTWVESNRERLEAKLCHSS